MVLGKLFSGLKSGLRGRKPASSTADQATEKKPSIFEAYYDEELQIPQAAQDPLLLKDVFLLQPQTDRPRTTIALFFPKERLIAIRDPNSGQIAAIQPFKHIGNAVPIIGRWGPKGQSRLGLHDPTTGAWLIWNNPADSQPSHRFIYGPAGLGWIPLTGNWTGSGLDGIGLYDPNTSTFLLKHQLEGGDPDRTFMYGPPAFGWKPVMGDWDGDGQSAPGLYDPEQGVFYLNNDLEGGEHELKVQFTVDNASWEPLVGDWAGIGRDSVGVFDPVRKAFHLAAEIGQDAIHESFVFDPAPGHAVPMTLDWPFDWTEPHSRKAV